MYYFILTLLLLQLVPSPAAAGLPLTALVPASSCGQGWQMDGKVTLYTRDNLSDRINGEAELYFPYGFGGMAYARYNNKDGAGFDVDLYQLGSPLDAFGVYATYRPGEGKALTVGAEGSISGSQLFLYQDRYFVRIEATGTPQPPAEVLEACARIVAAGLPGKPEPPRELAVFSLPRIRQGSTRYLAQSLLGYEFFRRGLMAEAVVEGASFQLFLVPEDTPEKAKTAFDRYARQIAGTVSGPWLEGSDQLYGNVVVKQQGRYLVGAVRLKNPAAGRKVVDELLQRVGR